MAAELKGWSVWLTATDFARLEVLQKKFGHRSGAAAIRHAIRHQYENRMAPVRGWDKANRFGDEEHFRKYYRLTPIELGRMLPAIVKKANLESKSEALRFSLWRLAVSG